MPKCEVAGVAVVNVGLRLMEDIICTVAKRENIEHAVAT